MANIGSLAGGTGQTREGKSWILSLVAHLILIALLFLPVLVSQTPQPEPEGVMISLGMPDEGQGDEPPSAAEKKEVAKAQEEIKPVVAVKEVVKASPKAASKVLTSHDQDEITAQEAEANQKASQEAQRRAEAAKQQEAYNSTKKSYGDLFGGNGRGNTGKPGSQGDPSGDPNSSALEGISKGRGRVGGGLGNRGVLYEPKISDGSQKTGRVVISVCVDKKGKVIKADYTQKGSTTTDSELKDIARRAALQFKFTDADIEEQCGTITVDFKIRGS